MSKSKVKLGRVWIERKEDESPDLSWIGEYSNQAKDGAIDRQERGHCGRGEYRYFIPAMTGEETGNPDSPEQDYERMESYNRGGWCMIGIIAKAEVLIPIVGCPGNSTVQTIHSSGLWGIESDSGEEELKRIEQEELVDLGRQLNALDIGDRAIKYAVKHIERKE